MITTRATLAGLLFTLGGCATLLHGPRTTVMMPMPADSNEAAKVRRIAVLPFDGNQGKEFATEIQGVLAGVKINDTPYFSVADRGMNDHIFAEIKLSQSSVMSRDQALRLGRLLGVKGMYTGTAGNAVSSQSSYQETRSTCNDTSGKLFSKCKNPVNSTVTCSRIHVTYSFSPKLIDAETGQVIYARTIAESATSQSCPDSMAPALTTAQLTGQARQLALGDFLRDVAPSYQAVDIQLLDSAAGLDAQAHAKLTQGISFAVANRLDRACELWGEINRGANKSSALYYDLGVCAEAAGSPDDALQLYTQADRLLDRPDEQVSVALARVRQAKRNAAKFSAQTK